MITAERIQLFRSCFRGLAHVYGTYDPATGRVWQVKATVTDQVIRNHLEGRRPYGVYLLDGDRTSAVVADFDQLDPDPPRRFLAVAAKRSLPAYLERSKGKGWHVWIFAVAGGVMAATARRAVQSILQELGLPKVEVFPKQDRLSNGASYGNFINVPLFGRLLPQSRCVFVNPDSDLQPFPDQWALLASIRRVTESQLESSLPRPLPASAPEPTVDTAAVSAIPTRASRAYALPPCARHMLECGVSDGQRVACFRLAVHFKRLGIPQYLAFACLTAWARKNHPLGKGIITTDEIAGQLADAYGKPYRGYGCHDPLIRCHCHPSCPLSSRQHRLPFEQPAADKERSHGT
jgi:hypothetical protein